MVYLPEGKSIFRAAIRRKVLAIGREGAGRHFRGVSLNILSKSGRKR